MVAEDSSASESIPAPLQRQPTRPYVTLVCAALLCVITAVPQASAQAGEEAAVRAVVRMLFEGMRTRDEAMLRAVFAPEAKLGTASVEGFINAVLQGERQLDEISFDETVLIDGDLAMAWTPYNLYVDGVFQHCGVNAFLMRRLEGVWRIRHLEDTRRREDCDPQRGLRGPNPVRPTQPLP